MIQDLAKRKIPISDKHGRIKAAAFDGDSYRPQRDISDKRYRVLIIQGLTREFGDGDIWYIRGSFGLGDHPTRLHALAAACRYVKEQEGNA